jgi:hypothetical protein
MKTYYISSEDLMKKRVLQNKGCDGCRTTALCYIKNEQSGLCPCIDCLIKVVCKRGCPMFNDFVDSFTPQPNEAKSE